MTGGSPPGADVSLCICTFRRAHVVETLASVAASTRPHPWRDIIVIDNDDTPSARDLVTGAAARLGLQLRHVHAPARNISIARNAALDSADTRWIAFLDDDETVCPDWLHRLLGCAEGTAAVVGRTMALYPEGAPRWLAQCDFHSAAMNGRAESAYTGNSLIDRHFARDHGIAFDETLGRTGGEDTMFFRQLHDAGGRIAYCADSVVLEPVPPQRAQMKWILRRKFRSGQTHAEMLGRTERPARPLLGAKSVAKAAYCGLRATASLGSPSGWRQWLARGTLHAGIVAHSLGFGVLEEYASGSDRQRSS